MTVLDNELNPVSKLEHSYRCKLGEEDVVEGQVQVVQNSVGRGEALIVDVIRSLWVCGNIDDPSQLDQDAILGTAHGIASIGREADHLLDVQSEVQQHPLDRLYNVVSRAPCHRYQAKELMSLRRVELEVHHQLLRDTDISRFVNCQTETLYPAKVRFDDFLLDIRSAAQPHEPVVLGSPRLGHFDSIAPEKMG